MMRELFGPEGTALGHKTIDEIGARSLPVSPQNYEVWLSFLMGANPDLAKRMEDLISQGRPITSADMDLLYERFFSTTQLSTQVIETGSRIAHEIADALDALKKAGVSAEQYGETLRSASDSLSVGSPDRDAIRKVVAMLASATTEMSAQNSALSEKLVQSSNEVEQLRRSLQQARAEALTDGLTGVANRKLFDQTLRLRCDESRADKTPLCLLLCDIDHFKKFNDTWGHQTGDQVIRYVATLLAKAALPDQLVARYGGEEFAMVMPRTRLVQAERVADQVRRAIEAKRLVRRSTNETIGSVTISVGVSELQIDEAPPELVSRADACLYLSKRTGRNRVTTEVQLASSAAA